VPPRCKCPFAVTGVQRIPPHPVRPRQNGRGGNRCRSGGRHGDGWRQVLVPSGPDAHKAARRFGPKSLWLWSVRAKAFRVQRECAGKGRKRINVAATACRNFEPVAADPLGQARVLGGRQSNFYGCGDLIFRLSVRDCGAQPNRGRRRYVWDLARRRSFFPAQPLNVSCAWNVATAFPRQDRQNSGVVIPATAVPLRPADVKGDGV